MRVKKIPFSGVSKTKKRYPSTPTPLFGPNSFRPIPETTAMVEGEARTKARLKKFSRLASALYKSGVITLTTFERECPDWDKSKDGKLLRRMLEELINKKIKDKIKKTAIKPKKSKVKK